MSSLFLFLIVVQAIIAAALVGVILMQRSEGGGLGVGGNPTGLMSARGAADFLTRITKWLAIAFVLLSIVLAAMAAETSTGGSNVESTLDRSAPAAAPAAPAPEAPAQNDPLSGAAG
ncbi:preprotein translocase subunit SecG [Altererythrobacter sp. FM1]|uniref:Protein-export membrane protein SecG n=1 Tax=Tsuneonella flava TaxID=2055955 RepID=A0ABX7K7L3_9SPHN|nr:preprotein translocase subunit SecG [Tsuneonella flava]QSB43903.1 preprotein translocase subunit SecG [Tsuneonella flava]ROT95249.1 preprotein translocase subunit SecG [Altererythrobacter sp. FM1]